MMVVTEDLAGTLGTQPHPYHQPRPITQLSAQAGKDICDSLYLARHSFQDSENHFWKEKELRETQKSAEPRAAITYFLQQEDEEGCPQQ